MLHYRIAQALQRLGTKNLLTRAALRWRCRATQLRFSRDHIDVVRGGCAIRVADRHLAYLADMSDNFDHYFNQVEAQVDGGIALVDYSQPHLHRYRNSGLEFEFASLAEEIDALDDYFRWYTPQPGDTVFDIGAYCGASVYRLAQLVGPHGKVVAFEPDPTNYELLGRNVARHKVGNVIAVPAAVADRRGRMEFFAEGALGSTLAACSTRGTAFSSISVETMTFADACAQYGVPTFAKVDVEGAEIALLSAATATLRQHPIHFALDTNHRVGGKTTASVVESIFRAVGYRAESSAGSGFMTTWASPQP